MKNVMEKKEKRRKLTSLGFTLVELLAVIVILAIVLIIAVPGVLSIINKTKDNAYDRQIDMIKEATKNYVTANTVSWTGENPKSTLVTLDMLKSGGYLDKKIIDPRNNKEILCAKVLVTKDNRNKIIYDVDMACNEVQPVNPKIGSGMIPIVYKENKWVKADSSNPDFAWFNYENQQWANVATVSESTREAYKKADIGTEVKMEDINAMFVWVPRFKYKLWNVDGDLSVENNPNMAGDHMIDVQLEINTTAKSNGTQNGEWLTHPAFTFGNDEIDGFWVGKFLTGYAGATTTDEARVNVIDPSKVLVKPSTYYWNDIAIYNAYQNTIKLRDASNVLGMDSTDDPHMMKNMEWGAVVYLTSSKYGKQGNPNYVGVDKQVRVNNNSAYITGCGADTYNGEQVATCNTYETVNGQAASTTGNITGIYDMAGKWQYVMAGVVNSSGVPQLAKSLFPKEELVAIVNEGKYIDTYVFGNSILSVVKQGRLGDATKELAPSTSWYDTTLDPLRSFSGIFMYWSNRGGGRSGQLYSASGITGQNLPGFGFRVTLAIGTNTSSGI